MTDRERYMRVMRQDFPQDFADEDPFLCAMEESSDLIWSRIREKNTAGRMPKSGGDKNMARQSTSGYSVQDKCDYYAKRANNPKLTEGQRQFAQRRLNALCSGGKSSSAPAQSGNFTSGQKQAYHAGAAYGLAKTGRQMQVKPENKASFQAGVKAGRSGKYAKK